MSKSAPALLRHVALAPPWKIKHMSYCAVFDRRLVSSRHIVANTNCGREAGLKKAIRYEVIPHERHGCWERWVPMERVAALLIDLGWTADDAAAGVDVLRAERLYVGKLQSARPKKKEKPHEDDDQAADGAAAADAEEEEEEEEYEEDEGEEYEDETDAVALLHRLLQRIDELETLHDRYVDRAAVARYMKTPAFVASCKAAVTERAEAIIAQRRANNWDAFDNNDDLDDYGNVNDDDKTKKKKTEPPPPKKRKSPSPPPPPPQEQEQAAFINMDQLGPLRESIDNKIDKK